MSGCDEGNVIKRMWNDFAAPTAMTAPADGEVNLDFATVLGAQSCGKNGRLRASAVTTKG